MQFPKLANEYLIFRFQLAMATCLCGGLLVTSASPSQAQTGVFDPPNVAVAAPDVNDLAAIEARVQAVVAKTSPACVAISDGVGVGSGVVINKSGLILTAGHVMSTDQTYEILFPDGRLASAKPLGKNLDADSGMVQITTPGDWPTVELGTTANLRLGDWVVSLGHSGGFELGRKPPVRTGRLVKRMPDQLVTDAVLIGGDSGGPLFDLDGKLIGIHSSIGDSIAENRHVTIESFRRDWKRLAASEVWGQLQELNEPGGENPTPKMGVRVDKATGIVTSVAAASPAADVGIEVGDQFVEFGGERIRSGRQLIQLVKKRVVGDVVRAVIRRRENDIGLEIRLR